MKKLSIVFMSMLLVFSCYSSALCAERIYVSVNAGTVSLNDSDASIENSAVDGEFTFDQGYVFSAAIGNKYKTGVRSEFEV